MNKRPPFPHIEYEYKESDILMSNYFCKKVFKIWFWKVGNISFKNFCDIPIEIVNTCSW